MVYGSVQHTMVIGKITNEGLWVFDTNWEYKGWGSITAGQGTHFKDGNGNYIEAKTDEEKAIADWYEKVDNTVRYHLISFESLARNRTVMSIYNIRR